MDNLNLSLNVKTREETGKKVAQLRQQGKVPAVLYGHKIKPINLAVDYLTFEKLYKQAGESTLVDLMIDDQKPVKVLIQDYQLDPKSNQFIHIDFYQIKMDEKLHTDIKLKFIGEPQAVKELGGVLVTNTTTLEVECLPQDLVHEIEVNLSGLNAFDDSIRVTDVKVPEGITVLNVPDDVVALVQAPRTEEELDKLEEKPEGELPAEVAEGEEALAAEGEAEGEKTEDTENKADRKDRKKNDKEKNK